MKKLLGIACLSFTLVYCNTPEPATTTNSDMDTTSTMMSTGDGTAPMDSTGMQSMDTMGMRTDSSSMR